MMWQDGRLVTDEGEVVAEPGMTIEQLHATSVGCGTTSKMWNGREYFELRPMRIDGHEFYAGAYFYHGILCLFTLTLGSQECMDMFGSCGWAGPDDDETRFYEDLARRRVEGQTKFSWGTLFGGYDTRAGYPVLKFDYTVDIAR